MAEQPIRVEIRRKVRDAGQVISAVALAPSRRVLGVVDLLVPLMPWSPLSERVGQAGDDRIVAAADELVHRIAEAVQTEPAG